MKGFFQKKKRMLSWVLSFVMVLSLLTVTKPMEVNAANFNAPVIDTETIILYPSGCLKSITITVQAQPISAGYAEAYGRIGIHNAETKYNWNTRFVSSNNCTSWPAESEFLSKDSTFVAFAGGSEFLWTDCEKHTITFGFEDGKVDLSQPETYHIYLWTRAKAYGIYTDAHIGTLVTENGVLKDQNGNTLADSSTSAHSHSLELVPEVAATCASTGNIAHYKCTAADCGELFTDAEGKNPTTQEKVTLGVLEHDWTGEWTVTKEATLTEEGVKETSCVRGCGEKKQESVYLYLADETITVTLSNELIYTGSEQTQEIIVKYGDTVLMEGVHYIVSGNRNTTVGTYTLTVTGLGALQGSAAVEYVINKASFDLNGIEFADKTVTYDGAGHSVEITGTLPEGVTVTYTNNAGINAGTYHAVATFTKDENHETYTKEATLTIEKVTVARPAKDTTVFTYNGQAQTYTIAESEYYTVSNTTATNAGSYVVNVSLNDKTNYQWDDENSADLEYAFVINKATYDMSNVVFEDKTVTYDGSAYSIEATNLPAGVTVVYENNGKTEAGVYTVAAKFTGNENYNVIADMEATLSINKATLEKPAADNTVFTYNGQAQTYTVAESEYYTVSNTTATNAGSYTVSVSLNDKTNYQWADGTTADLEYAFVINKATYDMSNVVFEDKTVTYDGSAYSIEATNLPAGVTVVYENNGKTEAGAYTVVAKFTGNDNYNAIADMEATLTINKAGGTSSDTVEATQLPGVITVPTMEESVVDEKGEEITGIVQGAGSEMVISIPGVTDDPETEVTWTSTNPEVASVDENGNIIMSTPGLTEIVVTATKDGVTKTETIAIVVEEPPVYVNEAWEAFKNVRLGTSWADIPMVRTQQVGETVDINFWGVKNWKKDNYEYVWTTSDDTVAVADKSGKITALKPGVVTMSLGLKNKTTGKFLNVKSIDVVIPGDLENKISLGTSKDNIFDKVELKLNQRIDINFYGVKNWKKGDYEYRWSSSEPTTVWVDKVGKITPIKIGEAIVTLVLVDKKTGYPKYVIPVTVTVK